MGSWKLELPVIISQINDIVHEYMQDLKPFIPDIAAVESDATGKTAEALYTAHSLYTDPARFTLKNMENAVHSERKFDNPMTWRLFTIWAYILTVTCGGSNDPYYKEILFYCASKARCFGDGVISSYIKARAMYNLFYNFTEDEMTEIFETLEAGIAAKHKPSILLKAQVLCNEEQYDEALPYLLMMADMRYKLGVNLFIREYIHNPDPDRPPHYQFLGELKTRTYNKMLSDYLAAPPADIAQFLKLKATGIHAACPICMSDVTYDLIYHDCREATHALCVMCYCKTADRCPTCRFDHADLKSRLVHCQYS